MARCDRAHVALPVLSIACWDIGVCWMKVNLFGSVLAAMVVVPQSAPVQSVSACRAAGDFLVPPPLGSGSGVSPRELGCAAGPVRLGGSRSARRSLSLPMVFGWNRIN